MLQCKTVVFKNRIRIRDFFRGFDKVSNNQNPLASSGIPRVSRFYRSSHALLLTLTFAIHPP